MPSSNEVEIARHDLRIEQLQAEVDRISKEYAAEREIWEARWKDVESIKKAAWLARMLFIGFVALGSIISWIFGVTDHVRKWIGGGH